MKKDLLSVNSNLTTDFPSQFEFKGHGFVFRNRSTNLVSKGGKWGGLSAVLDGEHEGMLFSRQINSEGWHQRLGHPWDLMVDNLRFKIKLPMFVLAVRWENHAGFPFSTS